MITVAYITMRLENQFDWFFKGLCEQKKRFPEIAIQLIVVDYWKDHRRLNLENDCGIECLHVSPLPSLWQGKHKVTKENWFTCANSRNTVFVYAKYDYIASCDDLTVLGDTWISSVLDGYKGGYCALGSYQKAYDMHVENGRLISARVEGDGKDSREYLCRPQTRISCKGDFLYGCSFTVPLEKALEINGFDCLTDSIGYEDQVFGIRLARVGCKFYYDRRMFTTESHDHVRNNMTVKRHDPVLSESKYKELLNQFRINRSFYDQSANKDCSHILIEVARGSTPQSVWNFFSLRQLRARVQAGQEITIEDMNYRDRTWYDDKLISEM